MSSLALFAIRLALLAFVPVDNAAQAVASPVRDAASTRFELDRELWDALPELAEPRLFAFQRGLLPDPLGFRNGDVVGSSGDLPVVAIEDVAYYATHDQHDVTVAVVRVDLERVHHFEMIL